MHKLLTYCKIDGFEIRETTPSDLLLINVRKEQEEVHYIFNNRKIEYIHFLLTKVAFCFTIVKGDIPVFIGGGMFVQPHNLEIFSFISDDFHEHFKTRPLQFIKTIKFVINSAVARRKQVTARLGFTQAIKLIKVLGFTEEGILRKFLPDGGDAIIFSKVEDDR